MKTFASAAPRVSVVVTCYNYGDYVGGCLDSVLSQTFRNFEVIVVDDGSTDHSSRMITARADDPRLQVINQSNQGQASAKNRGIRAARGELVAFLDADDLWEPEKLDAQVGCFDDPEVGVAYTRAVYMDEGGTDLGHTAESLGTWLTPRSGQVLAFLLFDNFIPFSSAMVRRSLLEKGFDERVKMAIDWQLWLNLSLEWRFAFVDRKLIRYRMGHSGQMSKNTEERFKSTDRILEQFLAGHGQHIPRNLLDRVLAHKYYLRWRYFLGKDKVRSRHFLKLALRRRIAPVLIARTLARRLLDILPAGLRDRRWGEGH